MPIVDRAIGDDTTELPPIVRDYCQRCGAYDWGVAQPHFRCMQCFRTRSALRSQAPS